MAEFKQYPEPMVFHQALVGVIPKATGGDLNFKFAVDGVSAGSDIVTGSGLAEAGKLLPLRIFPDPSSAGSLLQVAIEEGCDMVTCEILAAPIVSHKVVKELSEAQITYKGRVTIEMFFDGALLGTSRIFESDTWKTEKFYLPAGSRGYIFQWRQTNNADLESRGYVGSLETDLSLGDTETPEVSG